MGILIWGCSGEATTGARERCELHGDYTVTVEGCGSSSTTTAEHNWSAECRDGDVCDPEGESCSFLADGDGCEVWTTYERAREPVATCVLEGDYTITQLPDPGCGYEQSFPARVERHEVPCESEEQTCIPGTPSPFCSIAKRVSDRCVVRSTWELR